MYNDESSERANLTAPPAPSPRRAPSPKIAPNPTLAPSPARYAYLVGRLRGKQITMEEATELFDIQNVMMQQAAMASAAPNSGAPTAAPPTDAAPSTTPGAARITMSEDALWESLPPLAAALGIFAAIMKRAQSPDPPAPRSSPTRPPPTG